MARLDEDRARAFRFARSASPDLEASRGELAEGAREATHALWDELATRRTGSEADLRFALGRLAEMVGAQDAYWIGAVRLPTRSRRDPLKGFRPRAVRYLSGCERRRENYEAQRKRLDKGSVDPSIVEGVTGAGRFRAYSKRELMGEGWFESDYHRAFMAPFGIQDVALVVTPLGADVESYWGFQRIHDERPYFEPGEVALLEYAVRPLAWFQRLVTLQHGLLLAERPLTARESELVAELLTDKTEKEIAAELGLTASTVHTYAVRVYRKFGVRGRMGLMALWFGRGE